MNVLLDTCVVSELQRHSGSSLVQARVEALATSGAFLSVVTIGEITKGIALLADGARKRELAVWLIQLEQEYESTILPVDLEIARQWGELTARARAEGHQISVSDGLIAATARRHGLAVVTRNTRHFAATGAVIIDPWEH